MLLLLVVVCAMGTVALSVRASRTACPPPSPAVVTDDLGGADSGADYWGARPESIEELVAEADVVVLGCVGDVVVQEPTPAEDERGVWRPTPVDEVEPYVDLRIRVDEVFKDDGVVASGRPLIYRQRDSRTYRETLDGTYELLFPRPHPEAQYPMIRSGERYLFFLVRQPSGRAYSSANYMYGRLLIDGPAVRISDGRRSPLDLGRGTVAPAQLLSELRAAGDAAARR